MLQQFLPRSIFKSFKIKSSNLIYGIALLSSLFCFLPLMGAGGNADHECPHDSPIVIAFASPVFRESLVAFLATSLPLFLDVSLDLLGADKSMSVKLFRRWSVTAAFFLFELVVFIYITRENKVQLFWSLLHAQEILAVLACFERMQRCGLPCFTRRWSIISSVCFAAAEVCRQFGKSLFGAYTPLRIASIVFFDVSIIIVFSTLALYLSKYRNNKADGSPDSSSRQLHKFNSFIIPMCLLTAIIISMSVIVGIFGPRDICEIDGHYLAAYTYMLAALLLGVSVVYSRKTKFKAAASQQSLEMKRLFVRYVSHEIRTPLNIVSTGLKLLQSFKDKTPTRDEASMISFMDNVFDMATEMKESCDIAITILNDLLLYEKLEGGILVVEKKPTPAKELINSAVRAFAIQAREADIQLTCKFEGAPFCTSLITTRDRSSSPGGTSFYPNSSASFADLSNNSGSSPMDLEWGRGSGSQRLRGSSRPAVQFQLPFTGEEDNSNSNSNSNNNSSNNINENILVCVDTPKLSQVLRNLVSNAIKFSPAGGTVTVITSITDGTRRSGGGSERFLGGAKRRMNSFQIRSPSILRKSWVSFRGSSGDGALSGNNTPNTRPQQQQQQLAEQQQRRAQLELDAVSTNSRISQALLTVRSETNLLSVRPKPSNASIYSTDPQARLAQQLAQAQTQAQTQGNTLDQAHAQVQTHIQLTTVSSFVSSRAQAASRMFARQRSNLARILAAEAGDYGGNRTDSSMYAQQVYVDGRPSTGDRDRDRAARYSRVGAGTHSRSGSGSVAGTGASAGAGAGAGGGGPSSGLPQPPLAAVTEDEERLYVRVEVKDSGVGLTAENQKKLFHQIIQFNPNELQGGNGSGLGLFISKGIMDLHGGKIGVYSEGEGKGCTFYIEIPVCPPQDAPLPASHATRLKNWFTRPSESPSTSIMAQGGGGGGGQGGMVGSGGGTGNRGAIRDGMQMQRDAEGDVILDDLSSVARDSGGGAFAADDSDASSSSLVAIDSTLGRGSKDINAPLLRRKSLSIQQAGERMERIVGGSSGGGGDGRPAYFSPSSSTSALSVSHQQLQNGGALSVPPLLNPSYPHPYSYSLSPSASSMGHEGPLVATQPQPQQAFDIPRSDQSPFVSGFAVRSFDSYTVTLHNSEIPAVIAALDHVRSGSFAPLISNRSGSANVTDELNLSSEATKGGGGRGVSVEVLQALDDLSPSPGCDRRRGRSRDPNAGLDGGRSGKNGSSTGLTLTDPSPEQAPLVDHVNVNGVNNNLNNKTPTKSSIYSPAVQLRRSSTGIYDSTELLAGCDSLDCSELDVAKGGANVDVNRDRSGSPAVNGSTITATAITTGEVATALLTVSASAAAAASASSGSLSTGSTTTDSTKKAQVRGLENGESKDTVNGAVNGAGAVRGKSGENPSPLVQYLTSQSVVTTPLPSPSVSPFSAPASTTTSFAVSTAAARVMVVDDSAANRKMLVRMLQMNGICDQPMQAADGAIAVQMIRDTMAKDEETKREFEIRRKEEEEQQAAAAALAMAALSSSSAAKQGGGEGGGRRTSLLWPRRLSLSRRGSGGSGIGHQEGGGGDGIDMDTNRTEGNDTIAPPVGLVAKVGDHLMQLGDGIGNMFAFKSTSAVATPTNNSGTSTGTNAGTGTGTGTGTGAAQGADQGPTSGGSASGGGGVLKRGKSKSMLHTPQQWPQLTSAGGDSSNNINPPPRRGGSLSEPDSSAKCSSWIIGEFGQSDDNLSIRGGGGGSVMIGANLRSDSNLFTTSFIAPRHSQAFSQSQSQSQAESQSESVTAIDEGTAGIAYMENPLARIHTITETEAFTAASRDENEIAPTSSTTVNTAAVVFNQQRQHTSIAPSSSTVISTTSPGLSASNSLSVLSTTAAAGSATANGSGGVALKASTSPKRNFSFNAAGVLSSALSSSSSNSKGSGNNLPTTGIASAGIANRSSPALKQRFGFLVSGLDINHSHSSSPHAAANNKNNNNSNHSNHSASSTSNRLNQSQLQLQPQQLQLQQQLQQQSSSSSSSSLLQCPPSSCPEVILMDFVMPNLSGPAATEKIRHMGYRGVIIGVTGNALTEDVEYFMRSGANAVLTKPLDINEMLRIIENRQQSDGATGGGKGGGWRQKK